MLKSLGPLSKNTRRHEVSQLRIKGERYAQWRHHSQHISATINTQSFHTLGKLGKVDRSATHNLKRLQGGAQLALLENSLMTMAL